VNRTVASPPSLLPTRFPATCARIVTFSGRATLAPGWGRLVMIPLCHSFSVSLYLSPYMT
jgi:hypothetical protein